MERKEEKGKGGRVLAEKRDCGHVTAGPVPSGVMREVWRGDQLELVKKKSYSLIFPINNSVLLILWTYWFQQLLLSD